MMLTERDVKVALGLIDVERFPDFGTFHRSVVASSGWKFSTGLCLRGQLSLILDELVAAFGMPSEDTTGYVRCPYYFRIDDQFVCFYISGLFGDVGDRQFFNVVGYDDRAVEVLRLHLLESGVSIMGHDYYSR